jgi:hypothetical protein
MGMRRTLNKVGVKSHAIYGLEDAILFSADYQK